jgi:myo-inositol-1(or 4)-monophosphatase
MCHVASGITDGYWEYRLKPWDMAAGVLIAEEAGATVTTMDGRAFSVFDRSVLVSNGYLHEAILEKTEPVTATLLDRGVDLSQWFIPEGYSVHSGAQLE